VKACGASDERTTATDAAGEFRIAGLQDEAYDLEIREPLQWLKPAIHRVAAVRPSDAKITVEVPRGAVARSAIVGRVLDVGGGVPAKCVVLAWPEPLGQPLRAEPDPASGCFRFDDLPAATYRVTFKVENASHAALTCTTQPGATADLGALQLAAPGSLAIVAALADGTRPAGARGVAVLAAELARRGTERIVGVVRNLAVAELSGVGQGLGFDGNAFRARLAPGSYRIQLSGENFEPLERSVTITAASETKLALELTPAVRRSFAFDLPADAPWPTRLRVRATRDGADVYDVEWHAASQAQPYSWAAGFAPGRYVVLAETNTGLRGSVELEARGTGGHSTIELR
jgi:hypothetical protein